MDEGASPNIQNEFFNQARREKRRVAIFLNTGRRLTGRIRSFDKFTILLETAQGDQMLFKHAISTIGPVVVPARPRPKEGFNTPAPPRPKEGFNNRMDLARGRKGAAPASGKPAPVKAAPDTPKKEVGGSGDSGEGSAPTS